MKSKWAKKIKGTNLVYFLAFVILCGCGAKNPYAVSSKNVVRSGNASLDVRIGDEKNSFRIIAKEALIKSIWKSEISPAVISETIPKSEPSPAPTSLDSAKSLIVGFPLDLLGKNFIFGGVITEVSDMNLAGLKLAQSKLFHVHPILTGEAEKRPVVALMGCDSNCTEDSEEKILYELPVVGLDEKNKMVMIDLSTLGKGLNLVSDEDMKKTEEDFNLKTKSSETIGFDYSVSTLIFDVKSYLVPVDAKEGRPVFKTELVVRWFLKLDSDSTNGFVARTPTKGVGYFTTELAAEEKIARFSLSKPVKYYIKNVPAEFQPAFVASFDKWNEAFKITTGKARLEYEFVSVNDSRYALLVPGDIRYNIIEWDVKNKAPYAAIGPPIPNEYTGEMLSANILIREESFEYLKELLYVHQNANVLKSEGKFAQAEKLVLDYKREMKKMFDNGKSTRFNLKLGKEVFHIRSQDTYLNDSNNQRKIFDDPPVGQTYESLVIAEIRETMEHELGHNLGLRHNFRGNLGDNGSKKVGSVSRSVMEYMGPYGYLSQISDYDLMAISYGYRGKYPEHLDWFCGDDEIAMEGKPENSAECSKTDATDDPFSFFESRLAMVVNKLVARGSAEAPAWEVADMEYQLENTVKGMGYFAYSAKATGSSWTTFFGKSDRPQSFTDPSTVKTYVLQKLKSHLCDPSVEEVLSEKESGDALGKVMSNMNNLRKTTAKLLEPLGFTSEELRCSI